MRGDGFETFRTPTEIFIHPDDKHEIELAKDLVRGHKRTAYRKQWILNLIVILIFTGLAGLVIYFSK